MKDKIKWLAICYAVLFVVILIYNHFFVDASLLTYGLTDGNMRFLASTITMLLIFMLAYHIKKKLKL